MTDTTPKRRWFRFSLRTLFVLLTAFGIWLGWQVHIVSTRKQFISNITDSGGKLAFSDSVVASPTYKPVPQISWLRRIFGDRAVVVISFVGSSGQNGVDESELAAIKATFPEAEVYSTGGMVGNAFRH